MGHKCPYMIPWAGCSAEAALKTQTKGLPSGLFYHIYCFFKGLYNFQNIFPNASAIRLDTVITTHEWKKIALNPPLSHKKPYQIPEFYKTLVNCDLFYKYIFIMCL